MHQAMMPGPQKALFSPKLVTLLLSCPQQEKGEKDEGRLTTGLKGCSNSFMFPKMH